MSSAVAGLLPLPPLLLLLLLTHIGCDGVVGSPHVLDACGVCGGNSSSCQIISGLFTEPYLREGYRLVVQIPAGACRILIEELQPTSNYLALRDINQRFIVNGDWNIDNSGQYQGAGASFVYRRQSGSQGETITAVGPISQPVDIFILYRQTNRGIKYEYAIKRNDSLSSVLPRLPTGQGLVPAVPLTPGRSVPPPTVHRNVPSQTSPPALPPGGTDVPRSVPPTFRQRRPPHQPGRRRRPLVPVGRRRGQRTGRRGALGSGRRRTRVQRPDPPGTAAAPLPDTRPAVPERRPGRPGIGTSTGSGPHRRRRRRRRRRHRFQWVVHRFSECTRSCGGGTKVPEVVCMRRKRKQVAPDSKCNPRRKPSSSPVLCNTSPCPASSDWEATEWSACSVSCGSGHQTRTFLCVRAGQPVEVTECVGRPTEPATRPCSPGPCQPALRWNIGRWSPCSVSCGWGTRTRSVTCTDPGSSGWCAETERPRDMAPCLQAECPDEPDRAAAAGGGGGSRTEPPAGWMVTDWTHQCSVDCGQGVQSRGVACGGGPGHCDVSRRPSDTRPCKTDRGCSGVWFTGPWSQCSLECGVGGQASRVVLCLRRSTGQFSVTSELACAGSPRPPDRQPCGAAPGYLCAPRWFTADWTACSVSCGGGQQRRVVACIGTDGRLAAGCSPSERPSDRRSCQLADCPGSASDTEFADTSPALSVSGSATGKIPREKSALDPATGPEYRPEGETEEQETPNEIDVGPQQAPIGDHMTRLATEEPLWSHHLWAHTANQTLTARVARPDSGPTSGPDSGPDSGDSGPGPAGRTAASPGAPLPTQTGGAGDRHGPAGGHTALTDGSGTTRPTGEEEEGGGRLAPADHGGDSGAGNTVGADGSDSCTDKLGHCAVVKRARLCQTNFYATSCCASCSQVR